MEAESPPLSPWLPVKAKYYVRGAMPPDWYFVSIRRHSLKYHVNYWHILEFIKGMSAVRAFVRAREGLAP